MRDSNAMLSILVASPRRNKSVFKIRQLQGTVIQLVALTNNSKMADKIRDKWLFKVLNVASYVIYDE